LPRCGEAKPPRRHLLNLIRVAISNGGTLPRGVRCVPAAIIIPTIPAQKLHRRQRDIIAAACHIRRVGENELWRSGGNA
jgi:hypothetical protein